MIEWILTGFLLFRLWAREVGVWEALRGCAWVVVRKALSGKRALAGSLMPRLRTLELQIPGHAHPFYVRWPASDLHIVYTIIEREEYAPIGDYLDGATEIIFLDLGAKIGAASRYFLETFPRAKVIAVEPDAGNVAMCHMNLDPYGDRVRIVQAAVWSRNGHLVFERETTEAGTEAGIRVREPGAEEGSSCSVAAVDMPTLLSKADFSPDSQIALKIDVEGSEEEIFDESRLDWLDGVTCIAIELHDKTRKYCSRNFFSAVKDRVLEPPKERRETVFAQLKVCQQVGLRDHAAN